MALNELTAPNRRVALKYRTCAGRLIADADALQALSPESPQIPSMRAAADYAISMADSYDQHPHTISTIMLEGDTPADVAELLASLDDQDVQTGDETAAGTL